MLWIVSSRALESQLQRLQLRFGPQLSSQLQRVTSRTRSHHIHGEVEILVSLRAAQIRHATHSDKRNLVVVADLRNSGGLHVGADGALERLAGVLHVVGGYKGVTRQHLAAAHLPRALSLLTYRLQRGERMLQSVLPLIRLTVVAFGQARNLTARVTDRGRVGVSVGVVLANQHVAHVTAASQTAGGTCADDAQALGACELTSCRML